MTRKEEIEQEAQKFAFTMSEEDEVLKYEAFIAGAEWADEHPIHYDGKAYLYVLHKGVEQGKKEMIEKSCKWLEENAGSYLLYPFCEYDKLALLEDFKKAMGL